MSTLLNNDSKRFIAIASRCEWPGSFDAEFLKKIAFIQEGKLVKKGGIPTLCGIRDATDNKKGKVVITETTKRTVCVIESGKIIGDSWKIENYIWVSGANKAQAGRE